MIAEILFAATTILLGCCFWSLERQRSMDMKRIADLESRVFPNYRVMGVTVTEEEFLEAAADYQKDKLMFAIKWKGERG